MSQSVLPLSPPPLCNGVNPAREHTNNVGKIMLVNGMVGVPMVQPSRDHTQLPARSLLHHLLWLNCKLQAHTQKGAHSQRPEPFQ